MKEVQFSNHPKLKIKLLKKHKMVIDEDFVTSAILKPDKVERGYKERLIA